MNSLGSAASETRRHYQRLARQIRFAVHLGSRKTETVDRLALLRTLHEPSCSPASQLETRMAPLEEDLWEEIKNIINCVYESMPLYDLWSSRWLYHCSSGSRQTNQWAHFWMLQINKSSYPHPDVFEQKRWSNCRLVVCDAGGHKAVLCSLRNFISSIKSQQGKTFKSIPVNLLIWAWQFYIYISLFSSFSNLISNYILNFVTCT